MLIRRFTSAVICLALVGGTLASNFADVSNRNEVNREQNEEKSPFFKESKGESKAKDGSDDSENVKEIKPEATQKENNDTR